MNKRKVPALIVAVLIVCFTITLAIAVAIWMYELGTVGEKIEISNLQVEIAHVDPTITTSYTFNGTDVTIIPLDEFLERER